MGLALHDPSDSTYLSNLTEHRLLPGREDHQRQKFHRRPFHWPRYKLAKIDLKYEDHAAEDVWRKLKQELLLGKTPTDFNEVAWESLPQHLQRRHHLAALAFQNARARKSRYNGRTAFARSIQRRSGPQMTWLDDEQEGRALARSSARLPSDHARERRPPSLERQEAFRESSTSKKRSSSGMDTLLQDEELYRLGLLYDDEHERGSGFNLDAIVHDEPVFHIRPTKRGRSRKDKFSTEVAAYAPTLPLELSFSAFGQDEALAAFLISPDSDELISPETEAHPSACTNATSERRTASQSALATIFELELEFEPEYDSYSEPSTFLSFHTTSNAAAAASDLSEFGSHPQHSGHENDNYDDDGDEAWAFLDGQAEETETETATLHDSEMETEDTDNTQSPPDADVWIVLG